MKKILGLILMGLLGGCAPQLYEHQRADMNQPLDPMDMVFHQDSAPLPGVHVLPSERAITYQEVDFNFIARHVRHGMAYDKSKFANVNLVLVDYGVLDAENPKVEFMKKKYGGQTYCKKYVPKPERYFMRLSFYQQNCKPPAPPLFMGAAVLAVVHAAPFEAMRFLVDEIILERLKTPLNKIEVNYDVSDYIEGQKYKEFLEKGGASHKSPIHTHKEETP